MTISIKSRKAKGRKLQNYIRDLILAMFPLMQDEVQCAIMGEKGVDIKLRTQKARDLIPYGIECKNDENISIWKMWNQAKKNAIGTKPLGIMMKNYEDPLAICLATEFFTLLEENYQLKQSQCKCNDKDH